MRGTVSLAGTLCLLVGCGGTGDPVSNDVTAAAAEAGGGEAAAPAVAEVADLDCDEFKPQSAPEGQPADDVLGLRPGMTQDQVRGVLQCRNANYAINVSQSNVSLPEGGQMSRVDLNADTGLDRVNVWLLGPAGGERLVHVERMTEYAAGKELPVTTIAQEVAAKYGAFDDTSYGSQKSGNIVRARDGQRMADSNSSYGECRSHGIRTDRMVPCLHVISYEVAANQQNPALASRFTLSVTSHAMTGQTASLAQQKQQQDVERAQESAAKSGLDL